MRLNPDSTFATAPTLQIQFKTLFCTITDPTLYHTLHEALTAIGIRQRDFATSVRVIILDINTTTRVKELYYKKSRVPIEVLLSSTLSTPKEVDTPGTSVQLRYVQQLRIRTQCLWLRANRLCEMAQTAVETSQSMRVRRGMHKPRPT
jgi:hypothetical protein